MAATTDTPATTNPIAAAPATTSPPAIDLTRPQPIKPMTLEDDPNHKMAMLIKKRGTKGEEKGNEAETKDAKTGEKDAKTTEKTETKPSSGLGDLIAGALRFRVDQPKKDEKKDEKSPEAKVDATKADEKKTETKAADKKTIVTKKKPEPSTADHMRAAAMAAAEAATAAVTAALPKPVTQTSKTTAPEDELPDDFRYEFEVAKHLAAKNPKYKDAPQQILDEYAKRTQYADRWEAQNAGKIFNPKDPEHNEFEESMERPWSDHEFNRAAIQMEAKVLAAEEAAKDRGKIKAMEEREAIRELTGAAQQTVNSVAMILAENVDPAAHAVIKEPNGFAKLQENDPFTAEALVDELNQLAPRIQTAIIVDDPQQRVGFDADNNPDQKAWLKYLYEKEAQYAGHTDEAGRLFASRSQFVKLPPEQQARRWFLDVNHLISEMVADAVQNVKARVEKERERGKKVAAALGYIPKPETNGGKKDDPSKADASKKAEDKKPESTNNDNAKPASPAAGGGAKIDNQGGTPQTGVARVLGLTGNILFGR